MRGETITAAPRQLLAGLPLGSQGDLRCQHCGNELYEGEPVSVIAARPAGTITWLLQRVRCQECTPSAIRQPTLGWTELLVRCRLGTLADGATQRTRLVVLEPVVLTSSPPAESEPQMGADTDASNARITASGAPIEHEPPRSIVDSPDSSGERRTGPEASDER
ncbi:hypothetical protein [Saliphagus sp. LR7]|uniref:hypothetical protein n=1 Tax=Saliphagus sp. LR7 TaxID=2282654 RepID=UPI0018E5470B|nr:hypothetical protein [Saliphagus sp. LR7]